MKTINKFLLTLGSTLLLASAATAAMTYDTEKAYVESYSGRTDIPVPVRVVSPTAYDIEGKTRVEVRFTVNEKGKASNISFRTPVNKELAAEITSAVKEWKFIPETRNGTYVARDVVVPFVFNGE